MQVTYSKNSVTLAIRLETVVIIILYLSCIPDLSGILHNMWADEDHSLSFTRSRNDWESSFSKTSTRSFKPTSLFALADLDAWDDACLFKAQSSAQCGMAAASGLGLLSNTPVRGNTCTCSSNKDDARHCHRGVC
ncbi:hypothetical protein N1851_017986 [Merluccius polli]|uniref:Uncharacterized protein n=1 Tax=Merluccius polli TaxID=89951 RepID=A0AA47MPJ0_MERPO|nr:hypothetical protein N1851_017986 [Merluccius polli]